MIEEDLTEEIQNKLSNLPEPYKNKVSIAPQSFDIDLQDLDAYIEFYYITEPDYDYGDYYDEISSSNSSTEGLEYIFK